MRWLRIAILGSGVGRGRPAGAWASATDAHAWGGRLAGDDARAFGELYDQHARAVFSLAFRILGDQGDAEDVVQEVFAQAWRQAERYDPTRGAPAAWLLNMARSRAIDRLRRRRTVVTGEDAFRADPVDRAPGAEAAAITADQVRALRGALAALPAFQRIAIELAYYEGLSQSEIAERLDEPLGTVKTRVRLGLLKLREAMTGGRE
jgi:RNA polymerase sigma-70 factor (ECF subfamily)